MNSIKFEVSDDYKRQLKIRTAKEGKTLTAFILEALYTVEPPQMNEQKRIDEISEILANNGSYMSQEEREMLKSERKRLKKHIQKKI